MNIRIILSALLLSAPFLSGEQEEEKAAPNVLPFAWPFVEAEKMGSRGGTTQGSEVTLATEASEGWKKLQEEGLSTKERDRRAILALAGSYRVSFQFVETMGFAEDYSPPQTYFSWATEHVHVLEDRENFVSLQHTLVMYFKTKEGKIEGPMVMKHWRQDWWWEDAELHTYRGDRTWKREKRDPDSVKGTWTQAVYQVDDSPRYEVVGRWNHEEGVSRWESEDCWRPLPRREFSVRDDYNVLAGRHAITITPTGWVHAQDNRKLVVGSGEAPRSIASETGINRYERITEPQLAGGADKYWSKTGKYWGEVRSAWKDVFGREDTFRLKPSDEEKKLYQIHFGYAAELENGAEYDEKAAKEHAQKTIARFLVK